MAIRNSKEYFRIETEFVRDVSKQSDKIAVSVPLNGRKKIWYNEALMEKNTDILGLVPLVAIVPDDIELVKGGSIIRRKFMDRVLCQINQEYTQALINYKRVIKQKLALLKNAKNINDVDTDIITSYNDHIFKNGSIINRVRKDFIETFTPIFLNTYQEIAANQETVSIIYESNFSAVDYFKDAKTNFEADYFSKRIRIGTHRDDLGFLLTNKSVRKFASQGQIKTFIYSLKLSEYLYLSHMSENRPILLLDDIFEKLDSFRLQRLFELVISQKFGQIFITDTEKDRSSEILNELNVEFSCFHVTNNNLILTNG